jgi:hypothetical protein
MKGFKLKSLIISRSVLLRMRSASDKRCKKNQTHNNFFFENLAVYEIMCKNIVKPNRLHMAVWRMRSAGWMTKAAYGYIWQCGACALHAG